MSLDIRFAFPCGEHDDIARFHFDRLLTIDTTPARSGKQDVIRNEMFGLRHYSRHELTRGFSQYRPRPSRLDEVEVRAVQSHRTQYI
jgi:hypothetical protein